MNQIDSAITEIMASRETFVVGDRVRVTGAIAECQVNIEEGAPGADLGYHSGHPDWEVGLTGRVTAPSLLEPESLIDQGHTIRVRWDAPPKVVGKYRRRAYSPTELERIDP